MDDRDHDPPRPPPQQPSPTADDNHHADAGITLHEAAKKGLEQTILHRLDEGIDIDGVDSTGSTALHLAIKEGHIGAVQLLLDYGANLEFPHGLSAISSAAYTMSPAIMATVLKYRPNLEKRLYGLTPLFQAVSTGDTEVVRLLLEAGADATAGTTSEDGTGESVLHMAIGWWRNSMLPLLIRYGADVNAAGTNPAGQAALHIAAQDGNEDGLRELIRAGADVYARYPDGDTALHVAVKQGRVGAVSVLLDHGMGINTKARTSGNKTHETTPLFMAAICNQQDMVRFLLDKGAADHLSEDEKLNIVFGAAAVGRYRVLETLSDQGFPLSHPENSVGALSIAAYYGKKDAVIYLLRKGADPKNQSSFGTTAASLASSEGHDEVAELLRTAERQITEDPDAELFPDWNPAASDGSDGAAAQARMSAGAISLYATRRIHANQEPAGIFVCWLCKDLEFRRGMPRDAEVVYFMGIPRMRRSASDGCRGCRFLSDCLDKVKAVYGDGIWGDGREENIILHSMAAGAPLLLHVGHFYHMASRRVEVYVKEGKHRNDPNSPLSKRVSMH